jgi:hypothetical protein
VLGFKSGWQPLLHLQALAWPTVECCPTHGSAEPHPLLTRLYAVGVVRSTKVQCSRTHQFTGVVVWCGVLQVPNFLLAAPTLLLSAWGVATYTVANRRHMLWGGLLPAGKDTPSPQGVGGDSSQQSPLPQQQQQTDVDGEAGHVQQRYWLRQRKGAADSSRTAGPAAAPPRLPSTPEAAATTGTPSHAATRDMRPVAAPRHVLPPVCGGGGSGGYLSPDAAVFIVHWGVMVAVCVSVVHIQVSTRLLSCCVPWYWWAAHLVQRSLPPQAPVPGGNPGTAAAVGPSRGSPWVGAVLWGYCGVMMAAGAVLFPNFYPWT